MNIRVLPAFVAVAALVFTTAVPAAAGDRDVRAGTPPPDRIVIEITTINGTGCGHGTLHRFAGPLDDSWQTSDEIPGADLLWSSCTEVRPMGFSTLLTAQQRPTSPDVLSFFIVEPYTILHLTWRTCP